MTPQEEIKSWLDDDGKVFQHGFDLFVKYSRNRSLMLYLSRKHNMEKLVYELGKLLSFSLAEHQVKITAPIANKMSETAKEEKVESFKYNEFKHLVRKALSKDHKVVYDQIALAYKTQRTYHEKMKLATTDEARAELRAKVIEADDIISKGWKGLDAFKASKEKVPAKATAATVFEMSKEVNACRSYLSRGISELPKLNEKKAASRIAEMKVRVEKMISLNAPVKNETREALINLNIIDEKSNLVGE